MFTSKENSFEGNFNGIENDDKKKLATAMDKDDDTNFCFNSKNGDGAFLGRSLSSVVKIVFYMFCFCAVLSSYWGLCLWVFYQTLDNYEPKLQKDSSYIGHNPGLGYRPMITKENPYSSLLWFKHGASGNWDRFKNNLDEFLIEYEPGYWANAGAVLTKCFFTDGPLHKEKTCEFNKEWLSDVNSDYKCITEESYGYLHGKPCILVKINRIYGWNPTPYYNITEVNSLVDMPSELKSHITKTWTDNCRGKGSEIENKCPQLNMVWLHCDGEDDPDKENIGPVTYTPWRGFPGYFFPYYNQIGYLQPIVMVQLQEPTPGVLINIECTAWTKVETEEAEARRLQFSYSSRDGVSNAQSASNSAFKYLSGSDSVHLEHDHSKNRGSMHIELLMD